MNAPEPVLAFDARLELGESPVWDERTRTLLAVDILRGSIVRFDPDSSTTELVATLNGLVGAVALRREDGLVAAVDTSVLLLDAELRSTVVAETPDAAGLRFNDGACDPQGRFWVGTMALDESPGRGTLYRYDERGLAPMVSPVSISNGIDWSVDGTRMIYADSTSRRIDVFAFDPEDGSVSDRRTFVDLGAGGVERPRRAGRRRRGSRLGRALGRLGRPPLHAGRCARPRREAACRAPDELRLRRRRSRRPVHHLGAHRPHARCPCSSTGRRRRVRPSARRPRTSAEPVRGLTVASRS